MLKRLLSLVFAFVFVFNIGFTNLTFADDDDAFGSQGIPYSGGQKSYVDQCKDEFGNITDVDCAVRGKISDMKEFRASSVELKEIGPNKEYDIHLWTYDHIDNFYNAMAKFMGHSVNELHKNNILASVLNTSTMGLKRFLNLSYEEASESFRKWLKNSKYTVVSMEDFDKIFQNSYDTLKKDKAEFAKVKEEYQKDYSKKGGIGGGIGGGILGCIGGLAVKGLTLAVAGTTAIGTIACAAICGGIGHWIGGKEGESVGNEKAAQKAEEHLKDYNRFVIRTDVYANTIEQVFDKINRLQWVGNDLLLAKLNFDPLYHRADTEFRKEGFHYDESKVEENFKYLKQKLNTLLKKNNLRKEGFPYDEGKIEKNFKDLKQKLNTPLEKHNIRKDL